VPGQYPGDDLVDQALAHLAGGKPAAALVPGVDPVDAAEEGLHGDGGIGYLQLAGRHAFDEDLAEPGADRLPPAPYLGPLELGELVEMADEDQQPVIADDQPGVTGRSGSQTPRRPARPGERLFQHELRGRDGRFADRLQDLL